MLLRYQPDDDKYRKNYRVISYTVFESAGLIGKNNKGDSILALPFIP